MTRIRLIYLDREIIKPMTNIRQAINNIRKTDYKFIRWEYV